jgi:hypothetical protein
MKHNGIVLMILLIGSAFVPADITYTLHLDGVDTAIRNQITASMSEAVALYNRYGSFNKHLNIYYSAGVPTAQANFDGVITFGGTRNTRVALHEMSHTLGVGTYSAWSGLMTGGTWDGSFANTLLKEFDGAGSVLNGDGTHLWPYGLNYDNEDGFAARIRHIKIVAAVTADMGLLSYAREPEPQVVSLGDTAVFRAQVVGTQSYAWYKSGNPTPLANGGDISGATSNTLRIANVNADDEGFYYCVAAGLASRPAKLAIRRFVSHWQFDGNGLDSVGVNDVVLSGSPAFVAGRVGQAIDFDGVNDVATLPAGVADAEDLTVAAWVNWDGGNQWQRIFDFGTSTDQNLFLTPRSGDNTLRFAIKNGGSEQGVETAQLATGQWVHLAVTLRGDTATLYVNGVPAAVNDAMTIDPIDFTPTLNYIGDSQWSADPLFNGRIDDFRIYGYALSGDEIYTLGGAAANRPPAFTGDPILMPAVFQGQTLDGLTLAECASDPDGDPLTFSKVSGPRWLTVAANGDLSGTPGYYSGGDRPFVVRVTDSFGATDDAVMRLQVYGTPDTAYAFEGNANDSVGTHHAASVGTPTYVTGKLGQAIDLDGASDSVKLPASILNVTDFTIAAWVNWDGGNQWQRIFDFGAGTSQYLFLTPHSYSNTLRFAATVAGNGYEQRIETTQLPVGQWTHVAVTVSGSVGRLYVNGVLRDTNNAMTIDPVDISPTLNYIGDSQWETDPLFNGRIDEFRIYHEALSDIEIAMLAMSPTFAADPIYNLDAIEDEPYTGEPLTAFTNSPYGTDVLTYSKTAGPAWLTVAPDGMLSGTPADADVGDNVFTIRVENPAGLFDTAQMRVYAADLYTGVRGLDDLAGLAAHWLNFGCTDTPPCAGADLSGDGSVNLSDLLILSAHWQK